MWKINRSEPTRLSQDTQYYTTCMHNNLSHSQWRHQKFCCAGASRGQNVFLREQKPLILLKMADFDHFFFWQGRMPPSLDVTTGQSTVINESVGSVPHFRNKHDW